MTVDTEFQDDLVNERIQIAQQALSTFQELAGKEQVSAVERDAAIQRFEYTFEAVWKAAQRYLLIREGIDAGSPKAVIRACWQSGILDEAIARQALTMVDDRNLTMHTYNEALAQLIYSHLGGYANLLNQWLLAMQKRLE
jgi:nucleotidyltransferase substrate binding protein (TIGR01987 family)